MELKFLVHRVSEFKVDKVVKHEGVDVSATLSGLEVELVSALDNCGTYVHRVLAPEAIALAKELFVEGKTVVFNIVSEVESKI